MPRVRCDGCGKYMDKVHKTVQPSDIRLVQYQACFGDRAFVGAKFCSKCSVVVSRGERQGASSSSADPGPSGSRLPTPGSSISSPDDLMDVDFEPPQSRESPHDPVELLELPYKRVMSTESQCFVCGSTQGRLRVTPQLRSQVFVKRRLFVPKSNRVCERHLVAGRLYTGDLLGLHVAAESSLLDKKDLIAYVEMLANEAGATIKDKIGDFSLTDEQIKLFTGLNYDEIASVASSLTSMRNVEGRSIIQALVIFLFKMRTGNSNAVVAAVFGLPRAQQISDIVESVTKSFEKDVLPRGLGFSARTRSDLIENETSDFVRTLFGVSGKLALIYDGTYLRHGKSANNSYQMKSYSGQKKTHLCKPFTICTTTGYVIDMLGPFTANLNDAKIMKDCVEDSSGLGGFLEAGDVCFVDRGFRDVKPFLESKGYTVYMPSLKTQKQLTTEEANYSRFVTKVRWAVEAVHGIIKQKYRILDHRIDNDLLPKIRVLTRIACYLNNTYGRRLRSDQDMFGEVSGRMLEMQNVPNTLAQEAEEKRWNLVKRPWIAVTSASVPDFPEMTERDLKIFFTGTYQLSQAVSYLAAMLKEDNSINVKIHRDDSNVLKVEVPSRHIRRKTYRCYIDYVPQSIGHAGVRRHYCECANGKRTVGCCSHVAAVVYYLSYARFLNGILKPADILSSLFHDGASVPVINEDSDED